MTVKYALLLLIAFTSLETLGQLKQTGRFETEVKRSDDPYHIIPADSMGLFLFQETDEYSEGNKRYDVIRLNRALEKEGEIPLFIDTKYQWLGYEVEDPDLYLLFRQGEYNKSDLHIIRLDSTERSIKRFDIENELEFDITHFTVCNKTAVMGGYVNQRPALILYDFEMEKVSILPGFYLKNSKLIDIKVNVNKTFNVLIYNEENARKKNLQVKVYDWKGNLLAEDLFKVPEDKNILSGITSRLVSDNLVLTGTFSSTSLSLSEGIYWGKVDLTDEDKEIQLIPYGEINSFFDHLPEKRRERLKRKTESSSKDFVHKSHVLAHRIMENDGEYLLLLEKFDPDYARPASAGNPYIYNNRLNPYNYSYQSPSVDRFKSREFVNIQYEEAMVIAFNEEGKILWDQAIVMDKVESDVLEQMTALNTNNNDIVLAYKHEDVLNYKIVNGGEVIKGDTTVNIMLAQVSDILKNEKEGGIEFWYKGVFFVWGYQSIRRTSGVNNERLQVFYINKLQMEN